MPRIAVVTPRYGPSVIGGAESQARGLSEALACMGWDVEVWTSCAESHYSWENVYPAGSDRRGSLTVCRFPITHWNPDRHAALNGRLAANGRLSPEDEFSWLKSGAHSFPLYEHAAKRSRGFDIVLCLPYTSPLVHFAAHQVSGARLVIVPCLHDEPYAYMHFVRLLLESAAGVMFLSPEECQLALGRLNMDLERTGVVGGGIALGSPLPSLPEPIADPDSYLLYIGRLEGGKNLGLLYDGVRACYEAGIGIRLVVMGRGPFEPPDHPAFAFRGFVDEHIKMAACASAIALCQPSVNESFSMTIMESWLAATPVMVHADCAVTRGHVLRSSGGLYFRDAMDFQEEVGWLLENPRLAQRMGKNGRRYVLENYTWRSVTERFQAILTAWGYFSG